MSFARGVDPSKCGAHITGVVLKDSDEEVSEEEPIARQSQ